MNRKGLIYTCTLNPAVDYYLDVHAFTLGELNRADESTYKIGGKGLNVSFTLAILGDASVALGFLGGFTGRYIEESLKEEKRIRNSFTPIESNTRINLKMKQGLIETEINGPSPRVKESEVGQFYQHIKQIKKTDILVLSGSAIDRDVKLYQSIAKYCFEQKISFILDVEKEAMFQSIKYEPFLIKPNLNELESYFDATITREKEVVYYAKKLLKMGAKNVLISLGKQGSYFVNDRNIYHHKPKTIKAVNTIGAGDSMVAGFLHEYCRTQDVKKAYKMAIACASASISAKKRPNKEEIKRSLEKVQIQSVSE